MSFDELRAFLAVAQHGSFAAAASALGVARTSLRRHVDALEAQVGTPLLERGQRGAVLTAAGEQLRVRGRSMEHEFATMLTAIRETGRAPSGLVRVLLPIGLPSFTISAIVGLIRSSWPGVRLRIRWAEDPCTAVDESIEFVFWFGARQPVGAWQWRTVMNVPVRLLASEAYVRRRGAPTTLAQLADHDLYVWSYGAADPSITLREGRPWLVDPVAITSNAEMLHEVMHQGLGLVWVPDAGLPLGEGKAPPIAILDELVGSAIEARVAVPQALADLPRIDVMFRNLERFRAAATPR